MPHTLLQIVPRLPPTSDGVADYARLLAQQLSTAHDINTELLAFRPHPDTPEQIDGFRTHPLHAHTQTDFLSLLPSHIDGILLHYSNYPYLQSHFKAPFWFADALKTAKRARDLPVVVMFHELPTLKWKAIRVLNPVQTIVSKRLARLAKVVVTDSHNFKRRLQAWTGNTVPCTPDFSTIGEPQPEQIQPLSQRQPRLVIFGGADRVRAYQNMENLLKTCQTLGIEEICDIGAKQNLDASSFGSIRLKEMGFQPAETVREILLDSQVGYMDYSRFPGDLGKSSVFAAFCAHGVMPVCATYNPSEADGIVSGQQYSVAGETFDSWSQAARQSIATQARDWYCGHSLAVNAQLFADCFSFPGES